MAYFGCGNVKLTVVGPDEGVDVVSDRAVAQVKSGRHPTGRPVVQQIYGVAVEEGKDAYLFTRSGVTPAALEWAETAPVALFRLSDDGIASADNEFAERVIGEAGEGVDGWEAIVSTFEALRDRRVPALITSRFRLPDGHLGAWSIRVDESGTIAATRDFAGGRWVRRPTIADAVRQIAADIERSGLSFWDCNPIIEVRGIKRRFVDVASASSEVLDTEIIASTGARSDDGDETGDPRQRERESDD